jgi:hypothetical protein
MDMLITGAFLTRLSFKQIARLLKMKQADVEDAVRRGMRR